MCLLEELEPEQVNSDRTALGHPYDRELHTSMQTFWNLFSSRVTTQTVTCLECNNVTAQNDEFSEVMLKFPQQPSAEGRQHYTLASLYQHYTSGVIDDFRYLSCNSRTSATQQEHIARCPEVLTVILWRNADSEHGNIDNAVDFPLECVCPSTLGVQPEGTAEITPYKLFGIVVQHQTNWGGGGHYTAITKEVLLTFGTYTTMMT